jgi:hypothetical protein
VIIKPKGSESYTIKVKDLITNTEIEVTKPSLISFLKDRSLKKEGSLSMLEIPDLDNWGSNVMILSSNLKKTKQKNIHSENSLREKAIAHITSAMQKCPIIIAEIAVIEIEALSSLWFGTEEQFKKAKFLESAAKKDYALSLKKLVVKLTKDNPLIVLYSSLDTQIVYVCKHHPLSY